MAVGPEGVARSAASESAARGPTRPPGLGGKGGAPARQSGLGGRGGAEGEPTLRSAPAHRLGPDIGTTLEGACVPCDARHTQGLTKLPRHIPRLALRASSSAPM